MTVLVANNAWGTLAGAITTSSTSVTLTTGQGARFPSISGSNVFYATLANSSNVLEIVQVTATSGDTFTIVRAQDGTSATAYNIGDRIELRPTAALFNSMAQTGSPASFLSVNFTGSTPPTNGMYLLAANTLAWAVNTANAMTLVAASLTAPTFIPASSTVPTNGMFLPAANTIGFATNSTEWLSINSTGNIANVVPSSGVPLTVNAITSGTAITTTGGGTALNATGPAATQINALSMAQSGQTQWQLYQTASNSNLRLWNSVTGDTMVFGNAGNVTVSAPTSGTALTLNDTQGTPLTLTSNLNNYATATLLNANAGVNASCQFALEAVNNTVVSTWQSISAAIGGSIGMNTNHAFNIMTNGLARIAIAAAGTVAVNGVSGTHSTQIADSATNLFNAGFLEAPQNTQNANYTTVKSDSGKHIYHSSASAHTWTIDSNANVPYPIGTTLVFVNDNGGGSVTIAITSDTLRFIPGGTTGSRTLAANGRAAAVKITSTSWQISGINLT